MNWYKKIKLASLRFVGNCVNGMDDPNFIAEDATELAQIVENGQPISKNQFYNLCVVDNQTTEMLSSSLEKYSFYFNPEKNIDWFYDQERDIEYFYA